MNKRLFLFFAMCGVLIAAAPAASARPFYVDIGSPWMIGYHVSSKRTGDSVHFSVNLNREASEALENTPEYPPQVWFEPDDPAVEEYRQLEVKVLVRETPDKLMHLEFTIPKRLLVHCYLRVQSGPLRGDDIRPNMMGYEVQIAK